MRKKIFNYIQLTTFIITTLVLIFTRTAETSMNNLKNTFQITQLSPKSKIPEPIHIPVPAQGTLWSGYATITRCKNNIAILGRVKFQFTKTDTPPGISGTYIPILNSQNKDKVAYSGKYEGSYLGTVHILLKSHAPDFVKNYDIREDNETGTYQTPLQDRSGKITSIKYGNYLIDQVGEYGDGYKNIYIGKCADGDPIAISIFTGPNIK